MWRYSYQRQQKNLKAHPTIVAIKDKNLIKKFSFKSILRSELKKEILSMGNLNPLQDPAVSVLNNLFVNAVSSLNIPRYEGLSVSSN